MATSAVTLKLTKRQVTMVLGALCVAEVRCKKSQVRTLKRIQLKIYTQAKGQ